MSKDTLMFLKRIIVNILRIKTEKKTAKDYPKSRKNYTIFFIATLKKQLIQHKNHLLNELLLLNNFMCKNDFPSNSVFNFYKKQSSTYS